MNGSSYPLIGAAATKYSIHALVNIRISRFGFFFSKATAAMI
jgi:hypothetical protein